MIISHIVAVSNNYVIGKNNRLPWRMPDDMKYFHKVTMGHVVIMGRKNYEANGKALSGRTNIVITRNRSFAPKDAKLVFSINEALDLAKRYESEEIFIIGGGEIYLETLPIVNRIYITVIDVDIEGDAYYPRIDFNDYVVLSKIYQKSDDKNPHNHTYFILENHTGIFP